METVELYYDSGFDSWAHFNVRGQPNAIVATPSGQGAVQWQGAFDFDDTLEWVEKINTGET